MASLGHRLALAQIKELEAENAALRFELEELKRFVQNATLTVDVSEKADTHPEK